MRLTSTYLQNKNIYNNKKGGKISLQFWLIFINILIKIRKTSWNIFWTIQIVIMENVELNLKKKEKWSNFEVKSVIYLTR